MKFLVDQALAPRMALDLCAAGHDAVHTRDIGLARADDEVIFDRAADEQRIIVSADTDFGTLLALRETASPSVILFRRMVDRRPASLVAALLANLPAVEHDLDAGAVVVLEPERVRVRRLPIRSGE